jgi:hypothetical protein
VFDWSRERCAEDDIPDAPARAFRDAKRRVQLLASFYTNRRFIGRDFGHLAHPCAVVMNSGLSPDPAAFDSYEYLTATWTPNGKTVYALVHNEYRGDLVPGQCPSGYWLACWYNAITLAVSTDGGRHYLDHPWPKLVASIPYRYVPDTGPMLAFNPSNIIRNPHDGYFYATVHRTPLAEIPGDGGGTCLMRTQDLSEPGSWRAWSRGNVFDTTFVDPYGPNPEPDQHMCRIDPSARLYAPSITYNTVARQWLLVGGGQDGAYYSLSRNLVDWTPPQLIFSVPGTDDYTCPGRDPGVYFSLIDPASSSRNFETSGRSAYIYYTVPHPDKRCGIGFDRDLVRVPVRIR